MLTRTNPIHLFGPPSSDRDGEVEPSSDQPELAFAKCLNGACDKPRDPEEADEAEGDGSDLVKEHALPRSHRQQEAASKERLADSSTIGPDVSAHVSALTIQINDVRPLLVEEFDGESSQLKAPDKRITQKSKPSNPTSELWKFAGPSEFSPDSEPKGQEIHDQQAFDSAPKLPAAASAESWSQSPSPDINRVNTASFIAAPRTRSTELTASKPNQRSLGDPTESLQNESPNNILESPFDTTAPIESAPIESAPIEAAPIEAAPIEAAPIEAASIEAAPIESAPIEAAPIEDSGTVLSQDSLPLEPTPTTVGKIRTQILEFSASQSALDGESVEREPNEAGQAILGGLHGTDAEPQSFFGQGSQERKSHESKLDTESTPGKGEPRASKLGEISAASPPEIQESGPVNDLNSLNELEHLMAELEQPMTIRLSAQVIQQVVDQITSPSFELMRNEMGSSQLKVQIYPEQLGQLEITVTTSDEGMVAQITASEMITSELLNREKTQLMEALSDKGMLFPEIDISHHDSRERQQSEFQEERWGAWGRESSGTANHAGPHSLNSSARTSSMIDMLV